MVTAIQELENYQAKLARERRDNQQRASGYAAVQEINQLAGERLRKAVDWKQFERLRMAGEGLRYIREQAESINLRFEWPAECDDYTFSERAFSSPIIVSAINTEAGSRLVTGFGSVVDSTDGLVTVVPAPTYLQSETYTVEESTRLHKRTRGREAEHADFVAVPTPRMVVPYASQIVADEQSIINSMTTGGAWMAGFEELGRAAKRTYLDGVWSAIMRNPNCYDGVAMFHATHGNKLTSGSSALSATSLPTACQYLAAQVFNNDGRPIHASLRPTHLIVPPAIEETGRALCRLRMLDNDDANLKLVVENRISAKGVLDPTNDTVVTGSDTLWMLAASAAQRPAVIVSYLESTGQAPVIRPFSLNGGGKWGMGWDIALNVGVSIQDWRPWCEAVGA